MAWAHAGLDGQEAGSEPCPVAQANLSPPLLPFWLQPSYLSDQWCAAYFEQAGVAVNVAMQQQAGVVQT